MPASLPTPLTRTPAWIALSVLALAFVGLFWRWFRQQGELSLAAPDDWGHAFLIPIISGAMAYQRRAELATIPARTFWPGLLPLLLGIVTYFFFVVGVPNHMLQGASMLLTIAGLCLLLLGTRAFEVLFLPIAYLAFGITISEQVMIKVTFQLQLLATHGARFLLHVISLPGGWFFVDASGNTLEITHKGRTIPLNVAEACSGMRMVIAFIALAAAVAVFQCKHWWQRLAVVMLAVPVSLFMNIIRVAVLGLASMFDMNLAAGSAHMIIGTLLLVPGLALFMLVVWILERIVVEPAQPTLPASTTQGAPA